jgi:hypothetical protein
MPKPPFTDRIRAKLDELEVERRLGDVVGQAEHVVAQGVARAGELAHEHRDDIGSRLERAADAVDRHTDGRHADRITQVRSTLARGVDKLAEHRPDGR